MSLIPYNQNIWWFDEYFLHRQIKITPLFLIARFLLANLFRMAGLFKYFKRQEKPTNSGSLLIRNEIKEANKAVAKVLESTSEKAWRGKYNYYTPVHRAEIGKYAAENGATNAAKHMADYLAALSNRYCLWIIWISTFLFAYQ